MLRRELKINFKSFLIWTSILLLLFLVVYLIYPSIISSDNIQMIDEMMKVFPEEMLKAFNMDISSIDTAFGWLKTEGFIFVLLTVVVIFLLMLLLSDFRPTDEQAPVVTYSVDGNVKATLEEVDTATGGDSEDIESLLKSYTVDASDLKIYETAITAEGT